jgi:hypothetical protein
MSEEKIPEYVLQGYTEKEELEKIKRIQYEFEQARAELKAKLDSLPEREEEKVKRKYGEFDQVKEFVRQFHKS